ncbi:hypothetical protein [Klebsiella variicola]|uniref:hypothetical protein n=1 Tax=Klebsiella variicola TaxID=244366 RepID=UPI002B056CC5|nr:hypothetical protein [Klebsiella variicola]
MKYWRDISIGLMTDLLVKISEALYEKYKKKVSLDDSQISALVSQYRILTPNIQLGVEYGFLFTVVKNNDSLIFLPVGYGISPADAILINRVSMEKYPNISADIQKSNDASIQSIGGGSIDSQALWIKFNAYTNSWIATSIDYNKAILHADYKMEGLKSAFYLTESSAGIEKLKNQAISYSVLYESYKTLLIKNKIDDEIRILIEANDAMTKSIEDSLENYRKISEMQNFFNTCSFVLNIVGSAYDIYNNNTKSISDLEYEKRLSYQEVMTSGQNSAKINIEIIRKLTPVITNKDLPPKISYDEDIAPLLD